MADDYFLFVLLWSFLLTHVTYTSILPFLSITYVWFFPLFLYLSSFHMYYVYWDLSQASYLNYPMDISKNVWSITLYIAGDFLRINHIWSKHTDIHSYPTDDLQVVIWHKFIYTHLVFNEYFGPTNNGKICGNTTTWKLIRIRRWNGNWSTEYSRQDIGST